MSAEPSLFTPGALNPDYSAMNLRALGAEYNDIYGALNEAETRASRSRSGYATVYVPSGLWKLSRTKSLSSRVRLVMDYNAYIQPASGTTFTINAPFDAGNYQVFDSGSGVGTVVLSKPAGMGVLPQWWGALFNGSHDDATATNAALTAALAAGAKTYIAGGTCAIASPLVLGQQLVYGPSYNNIDWIKALSSFSGAAMIQMGNVNPTQTAYLRDIALDGNKAHATVPIGILVTDFVGQIGTLRDIFVFNVSGVGIKSDFAGSMSMDNIWVDRCDDDGILITFSDTAANKFSSIWKLSNIAAEHYGPSKCGIHIKGDPGAIVLSHNVRNITMDSIHCEGITDDGVNAGVGVHVESASNVTIRSVAYFGTDSLGDLVKLSGDASDTFNVIVENLSKTTGTLATLLNDAVNSRTITANSLISYTLGNPRVSGRMVQGDDQRATLVVLKTGFSDNAVSPVFTITTTDQSGSNDAGTYVCNIRALVKHAGTGGSSSTAVKNWQGAFSRAMEATGTGVNTALENVFSGTSAATASGTRDIGTITVTVVETSEYVQTVNFQVDVTGSGASAFDVTVWVEVLFYGFTTPPVIAAA